MEQPVWWYGTCVVVGDAAAVNLADLVTGRAAGSDVDAPYEGQTGAVVSLNFIADKNVIVGNNSAITADPADGGGAVLQADTSFTDSATGATGNVIPLSQIYIFSEITDATLTVFLRSLP